MRKILFLLLCAAACAPTPRSVPSAGGDDAAEATRKTGDAPSEERIRRAQMEKASGVTVEEVRGMFRDAAAEFRVPQVLLEAIGYVENNWIQVGPSMDKGWGVMHLVENDYCDTLGEAAALLKADKRELKEDPRQNIRGAAALLSSYSAGVSTAPIENWFRPAARFSGLISRELRNKQAYAYFSVINEGVRETNPFGETVEISAMQVDFDRLRSEAFGRQP